MRKEIELSEVSGRTVEAFALTEYYGGQTVVTFTDGTFICLGIEHGYDQGDAEIVVKKLDLLSLSESRAVELGIASAEEIKSIRAAENARRHQAMEGWERAQFDRLKRKFGE